MDKTRIVFRVDGNPSIGFGHVARCVAFAQVLSQRFPVQFYCKQIDEQIIEMVSPVSEVIELPDTAHDRGHELSHVLGVNDIVFLDGYDFDEEYQRNLKKLGVSVVCITDIPNMVYHADLIFNFSGAYLPKEYKKQFYSKVCAGARYILLRKPFNVPSIPKRFNKTIFVNMGGADPANYTQKVVAELATSSLLKDFCLKVVVGKAYSNHEALAELVRRHPNVALLVGLDATNMHREMLSSAIGVVSASTVSLEFASTNGLLFVVQTAENQALLVKYLVNSGVAKVYHNFNNILRSDLFETCFEEMCEIQRSLFDGQAGQRILEEFQQLTLGKSLSFVRATEEHAALVFGWAADPESRKYSYSQKKIEWEDHVSWFNSRIRATSTFYYIVFLGDRPVGQIRFDHEGVGTFVLSYLVDKEWRGKGVGFYVLVNGVQQLARDTDVKLIQGYVMTSNIGSIKTFERAGFKLRSQDKYPNSIKFEFSFSE